MRKGQAKKLDPLFVATPSERRSGHRRLAGESRQGARPMAPIVFIRQQTCEPWKGRPKRGFICRRGSPRKKDVVSAAEARHETVFCACAKEPLFRAPNDKRILFRRRSTCCEFARRRGLAAKWIRIREEIRRGARVSGATSGQQRTRHRLDQTMSPEPSSVESFNHALHLILTKLTADKRAGLTINVFNFNRHRPTQARHIGGSKHRQQTRRAPPPSPSANRQR